MKAACRAADRHDFTQGPILIPLLAFAAPLFGSSMLQSLNGAVNAIWIGRYLGPRALAAVASANLLLFLLLGAVFGVATAAQILVGRALGEGDIANARRIARSAGLYFVGLSFVVGLATALATGPLLMAMQTPPDVLEPAAAYLRASVLGLPFTYVFFFVVMMTRAAGGSRIPFIWMSLSVVLDIVFNPVLIFGWGPVPRLGVAGSAISTVLAQLIALAGLIIHLRRVDHPLLPEMGERAAFWPSWDLIRTLTAKGLPMGCQTLVVSSSAVVAISLVNRFGAQTTAAYGAAAQLWNLVQMPAMAVSGALSVVAAQNIGARNWRRADRALLRALAVQITISALAVGCAYLFDDGLLGLFTRDPATLALSKHINAEVAWSFVLLGSTFVFYGPLQAAGVVNVPLAVSIVSLWLVRLPFSLVLLPRWGSEAIWWGFPLAATVSVLIAGSCHLFGPWRRRREPAEGRRPVGRVSTIKTMNQGGLAVSEIQSLLTKAIDDARHGWSVGTFGAIGEFMRDADEPANRSARGATQEIHTERGAMRVTANDDVRVVAYDTLSSDGETWGQSVAFCLPAPADLAQGAVRDLGLDADAIRPQDRGARLFDLGVGRGHVRMCVRTRDAGLVEALTALEGGSMMTAEAGVARAKVLEAQPHRVMLSPIARVEVFSPIPLPGGESPVGPHTHLLPKLLASGRTHAANAPIPAGLQPVLNFHPRSPWRDAMGKRVGFDASLDALFQDMLETHALAEDKLVRSNVESAVRHGVDPKGFAWPNTRRGRIQARITLRRLTQQGHDLAGWRTLYDPTHDDEADEDAAVHA